MVGDHLVAGLDVGSLKHDLDVFEWHIQVAEAADDVSCDDLLCGVPSVSGVLVHIDRLQKANLAKEPSSMTSQLITALPPVVAEHIAAVNAFDNDRIVATFAPDAYVNDNRREIWGIAAIRKFMAKEFVGDHVTMEIREVIDHYGDIIVRARYDGEYDKTTLPDELIMSSYFALRGGKIVGCGAQRRPRAE